MRTVVRWLQDLARRHKLVNWMFHGIGVCLIILPFWIAGDPRLGAWVGTSIYLWREVEDVFSRWTRRGELKVTEDNLGDLAGPTLVFILAMIFAQ